MRIWWMGYISMKELRQMVDELESVSEEEFDKAVEYHLATHEKEKSLYKFLTGNSLSSDIVEIEGHIPSPWEIANKIQHYLDTHKEGNCLNNFLSSDELTVFIFVYDKIIMNTDYMNEVVDTLVVKKRSDLVNFLITLAFVLPLGLITGVSMGLGGIIGMTLIWTCIVSFCVGCNNHKRVPLTRKQALWENIPFVEIDDDLK